MAALSSFTDFLRAKKFPNIFAVLIPFVTALFLLIMLIIPLVPFFINQLQQLFTSFPQYINQASKLIGVEVNTSQLRSIFTSDIEGISKNALALTSTVFGGIFSILAVLVISFYLLVSKERLHNSIVSFSPKRSQEKIRSVIIQIENNLGAWVRGQILLSFAIGFATWTALMVLGLPFALPLAVLAGILEIVPTIGPIISSVPAIIVALSISPATALLVIAIYLVIQALENNILVPKIMQNAVGLNPIIIIVGIMIGSNLLGVLGALLAVPFISTLVILFRNAKEQA